MHCCVCATHVLREAMYSRSQVLFDCLFREPQLISDLTLRQLLHAPEPNNFAATCGEAIESSREMCEFFIGCDTPLGRYYVC